MKNLLLILGAVCWLAVGSALVIGTYENNQQTVSAQATRVKQNTTNTINGLKTQLSSTKVSLSTVQTDKAQACAFAKNAIADLTKYKITLVLPIICQ